MDTHRLNVGQEAVTGHLSRRAALLGGSVAVLASALAAPGRAAAQDGTPAATELTAEVFGTGMPGSAPGRQLILARLTFPAGFTLPAHGHPGALVGIVESGTFGYTPLSGEATYVTRAGAPGTPEALTHGAEVLLSAGDTVFHDEEVIAIDRAVGDEPAVLLVAALFDPTEPLYHLAEGTSTAGTPTG
jgi:hypothetical protein